MTTALYEVDFFLLVITSVLLPAGIDFVLLQKLAEKAKMSSSVFDDRLFVTELSMALYLLPAVFAGIGVNLVSHVVIRHLKLAENRFEHNDRHKTKS